MAKRIDRRIQVSSTHIDSQNEAMSKEALDSMARQSSERAIWIGIEHDMLFPPLGKMGESTVELLPDGHYGLFSDFVFYDTEDYDNFNLEVLNGSKVDEIKASYELGGVDVIYNHHSMSNYSRYVLKDLKSSRISEKSAFPEINIIIPLGSFVIGVVGKKYIEGIISELGIDPSEYGKKHVKMISGFIDSKVNPIIKKIERAFISTELKNKRLRIAYQFNIGKTEINCVIPFDTGKISAEELRENVSIIPVIANTIINDNLDLLESDKIVFAYDRRSMSWRFVYASSNDGRVIISNYGRIYQEVEQSKFVARQSKIMKSKDGN